MNHERLAVRRRILKIKNPSKRTMEEIGFDNMASISVSEATEIYPTPYYPQSIQNAGFTTVGRTPETYPPPYYAPSSQNTSPAKAGKTPEAYPSPHYAPRAQSAGSATVGKTPETYPPPYYAPSNQYINSIATGRPPEAFPPPHYAPGTPNTGFATVDGTKESYRAQTYDSSNSQVTPKSFNLNTQEEKKEKNNSQSIVFVVLVCFAVLFSLVILIKISKDQNKPIDGKIRVNYSSDDLIGSNCDDVISRLEKQGFTNIRKNPLGNLITGWIRKEGEVKEIEIDGYSTFSSDSRFPPDVEIVITYHSFPDKD